MDEKETNKKEKLRKIWNSATRMLSNRARGRIRKKVLKQGVSLDKAIRQEGVIFYYGSFDLSIAEDMFRNGELIIKNKIKREVKVGLKEVTRNTTFIPRPR